MTRIQSQSIIATSIISDVETLNPAKISQRLDNV